MTAAPHRAPGPEPPAGRALMPEVELSEEHVITCPGCGRPLRVPASAVGKPAHCPHCRAAFDLPAGADGTPGAPRLRRSIPRALTYPAFILLMLGLAGTVVNGLLTAQFLFIPGSDLAFARGRVREVRLAQETADVGKPADPARSARSALAGPAATLAADDMDDEQLARSWVPGMIPVHVASTALSVLVLVGAACMLRGRYYLLAVAGCVAAILNVNHLCCVPGAFAGVWGILALARDEVRPHFRR